MAPETSGLLCRLGLLGHRDDVVTAELADQLRVVSLDVRSDGLDQFIVGLGADHFAALAVHNARHCRPPFVQYVGWGMIVPPARFR
jgi:hypothetical protein